MSIENVSWQTLIAYVIVTICFVMLIIFGLHYAAKPLARILPQSVRHVVADYITVPYTNSFGVCKDPAGTAALQIIIDKLAGGSHLKQAFKVIVINAPGATNAFATPGSQIIIFDGLIQSAASPEALAGVLAHEMSHVIVMDPEVSLIRDNSLFVLMHAMLGKDPTIGHNLLTLKYSRDAEYKADAMAVEILKNAGISTNDYELLLAQVHIDEQPSASQIHKLLESHPAVADRIKLIKARQQHIESSRLLTVAQWQQLQGICN